MNTDKATVYTEVMELAWLALVDELVATGAIDANGLSTRLRHYADVVEAGSPAVAGGLLVYANRQAVLRQKYGIADIK